MSFRNKKILITGATGFVGANLVRHLLKQNARVSIFTRKSSDKWRIKDVLHCLSDYTVDLTDKACVQKTIAHIKPAIILHTAAYGGYIFQNDPEKMMATNLTATVNLLNACKKTGFEMFINTGSSSEYGIKNHILREDDLLEPLADYGVSKASATLYCRACAVRDRLSVVTLRLFSPYGHYDDSSRLIPYAILSCLTGKDIDVLSPFSVRDFIFIDDVVDAYCKVIQNKSDTQGEIFNIGYGKQQTVIKVAEKIVSISKSTIKLKRSPAANFRIEPKIWQADISKAKELLNWKPQFNIAEGLENTFNWFSNNTRLYKARAIP